MRLSHQALMFIAPHLRKSKISGEEDVAVFCETVAPKRLVERTEKRKKLSRKSTKPRSREDGVGDRSGTQRVAVQELGLRCGTFGLGAANLLKQLRYWCCRGLSIGERMASAGWGPRGHLCSRGLIDSLDRRLLHTGGIGGYRSAQLTRRITGMLRYSFGSN